MTCQIHVLAQARKRTTDACKKEGLFPKEGEATMRPVMYADVVFLKEKRKKEKKKDRLVDGGVSCLRSMAGPSHTSAVALE